MFLGLDLDIDLGLGFGLGLGLGLTRAVSLICVFQIRGLRGPAEAVKSRASPSLLGSPSFNVSRIKPACLGYKKRVSHCPRRK